MQFTITFNELSLEKQADIIESIKECLLDDYKREALYGVYGLNFGRKEYKKMPWQEAVVREYTIDYELWQNEEEARKFDWAGALEDHAEEEAVEKCTPTYTHYEVII
jgi:hypothetical protein